ncbi:hypothetical protein ACFYWN_40825 [Streptomyces sp. NPDC002917]|uniref:hypothetical protein n=1 Tax=Streptomyces sp. NPDC002917 TaxID=3364671 RepID=UPI0036763489
MLGPLKLLAYLSQLLLGRGLPLAGMGVQVACLLQQRVSVRLFGTLPAKLLIGHRGGLAGLGELFLPLPAG